MRYTEHPDPSFDIPVATDTVPGPNERHSRPSSTCRASPTRAAYETGRALRMIGGLLDSQGTPVQHGRLFLSQLGHLKKRSFSTLRVGQRRFPLAKRPEPAFCTRLLACQCNPGQVDMVPG